MVDQETFDTMREWKDEACKERDKLSELIHKAIGVLIAHDCHHSCDGTPEEALRILRCDPEIPLPPKRKMLRTK